MAKNKEKKIESNPALAELESKIDLEMFYHVEPAMDGFYLSDLDLVKQTNNLARKIANRLGWESPLGYLYYRSDNPRAREYWDLAVLAQEELNGTEIEGNIDLDDAEYDDIYGLKSLQPESNPIEFLEKMKQVTCLVLLNNYERTMLLCKYKDFHNFKNLETDTFDLLLNKGKTNEELINFAFIMLTPPSKDGFKYYSQYVCVCDYVWKKTTPNKQNPNAHFTKWWSMYRVLTERNSVNVFNAEGFDKYLGNNMFKVEPDYFVF